jgi:hypothetical protein
MKPLQWMLPFQEKEDDDVNATAGAGENRPQWFAEMGIEQTAGPLSSQKRMVASLNTLTELFVDMPRAMTMQTPTDSSSTMDERPFQMSVVGHIGSVRMPAGPMRTALPTGLLHECNALAVDVITKGCIVSLSSTEC